MKQLLIRPEIWEFSDFHTFAEAFAVGADDLIPVSYTHLRAHET